MFNTTYDTGFQSTAERSQTLLTTQPALLDVRTRYLCHGELSGLGERWFRRCCCSRQHFILVFLWSPNDRESPGVDLVSRRMGGFILSVPSKLRPRITFHDHQPETTERWIDYNWMFASENRGQFVCISEIVSRDGLYYGYRVDYVRE